MAQVDTISLGVYARFIVLSVLLAQNGVRCKLNIPYRPGEMSCPGPDAVMMANLNIPWGTPGRAYLTLPSGLIIAPAMIPGAGFGVISTTFIPKYTWLGEYEGEIVPNEHSGKIGKYAWKVTRDGKATAHIDACPLDRASYHRFVNSPNKYIDENVDHTECYGKIFYITTKDIAPMEELLVYYGPGYTKKTLDTHLNEYYDVAKIWREKGLNLNEYRHRRLVFDHNLELHDLCSSCSTDIFLKSINSESLIKMLKKNNQSRIQGDVPPKKRNKEN